MVELPTNACGSLRVGVYVCHCGSNIAGVVDVHSLTDFSNCLPGVAIARNYKYMCSDPGQALIRDDIRGLKLNRVVVVACLPNLHEKNVSERRRRAGAECLLRPNGQPAGTGCLGPR
jgi:heterodisulfide reductase subunit A